MRSLRDGKGDWVDKPPWRITWGGGASVESPHFQRVHYCELLVRGVSAMVPVGTCRLTGLCAPPPR